MKFLALVAMLFVSGCGGRFVYCTELAAELAECDVAARELRCELIGIQDRIQLADAFETRGCDAVWTDDGNVDERLCRAFEWACPDALQPEPHEVALVHPVVFVGGIDDTESFGWNPRLLDALAGKTGVEIYRADLSGWAPRQTRAFELWQSVRAVAAQAPGGRVNLVCYAVGGIDCRFLASPGGLFASDAATHAQVMNTLASITTIATPHRGTEVASAALYASDEVLGALLGQRSSLARTDADVVAALEELGADAMLDFNARTPNADGVAYFSWAGVTHFLGSPLYPGEQSILDHCIDATGAPLILRHKDTRDVMSDLLVPTAPFAGRTIGESGQSVVSPNDGMVSVESAKWGVFMGCIAADHYDVIGQHGDLGLDPHTGFDAVRFYTAVFSALFERGN